MTVPNKCQMMTTWSRSKVGKKVGLVSAQLWPKVTPMSPNRPKPESGQSWHEVAPGQAKVEQQSTQSSSKSIRGLPRIGPKSTQTQAKVSPKLTFRVDPKLFRTKVDRLLAGQSGMIALRHAFCDAQACLVEVRIAFK